MKIYIHRKTCKWVFIVGNSNPIQYSCLESSTNRGDWWLQPTGSQRVRSDMTEQLNTAQRQHLYNQNQKTTQMSTNRWIDMRYIRRVKYYLAIKKYEILQFMLNVDKPWKNYTKWKKPITKGHILCDALIWKFRVGKFIKRRSRSVFVLGLGTGRAIGRCPLVGMDFF